MERKNIFLKYLLTAVCLISIHFDSLAQNSTNIRLPGDPNFVFSFGTGYGISNNPCRECTENKNSGGAVFAFSLGYRINNHFRIDFGPSFWIEGKDLFNNSVSDGERPNNKRTNITFSASYKVSEKFPLNFRLGAGAGLLNYTPERDVVTTDQKTFDETEIFKGLSVTGGLGYELKISRKINLQPSVNLWYLKMEKPDIDYTSYIDPSKPSFTTEFRLQLNYQF